MHTLNSKDFSYLLNEDCQVVITGDSLAYNRYDYMVEPRVNAYECYAGMKSWAFKLRDYLISNKVDFISGRKTPCIKEYSYKYFSECDFDCLVPFLYEGVCIDIKKGQLINFKNMDNYYMYVLSDPNYGGEIEVDSTKYQLKGVKDRYFGYEILVVPLSNTNVKAISNDLRLNIIGFSKYKTEIYLTGSGSKSTKWLDDNYQERVLTHNPDLVIMIIGANDRSQCTVSEAYESLLSIVDKTPNELLLLSTPHSTTTDPFDGNHYVPDEKVTKPLMDNIYKVIQNNHIPFIDLFKFFDGIESEIWRFDNIHLTRKGNNMLFNHIINNFFRR